MELAKRQLQEPVTRYAYTVIPLARLARQGKARSMSESQHRSQCSQNDALGFDNASLR
jgi:hypothetical protein